MTQEEYNRKLQDVQHIEGCLGVSLLTRYEYRDKISGKLTEGGFTNNGKTVFRQLHPFEPDTSYWIDETLYARLLYNDPTK